jgi:Arc/MetJ-type ribon-helix-helix transcriptional regulator
LEGPEKVASVSIPTTLFKKLQDRIKGTGFDSVSDYVTYLLQEVMAELEMTTPQEHFSKDDEERVKERLRSLGYLG